RIARALGNSSNDCTRRLHSATPPSERRYETRASVMRCAPPLGSGQPSAWPATPSINPAAAVMITYTGMIQWAAMPAQKARTAAELRVGLQHQDRPSRPRQRHRRRQAVRPRTNDDRVIRSHGFSPKRRTTNHTNHTNFLATDETQMKHG